MNEQVRKSTPWSAVVISAYPEMFPGPLGTAISARACRDGIWSLESIGLRDFAHDRHRTIDSPPIGGGNGMVLRPDVLGRAHDAACLKFGPLGARDSSTRPDVRTIVLTPRGQRFSQQDAESLASIDGVIIVCGRYEGIDERFIESRADACFSIGDYVLSGGEIAAMVVLDAVVRLLPGTVGNPQSLVGESFASGGSSGDVSGNSDSFCSNYSAIQHAQYARPRVWDGISAPAELFSGDHANIKRWRDAEAAQAYERLRRR